MSADTIDARVRRANGIPAEPDRRLALVSRFVRNPWTWITVLSTLAFVGCLVFIFLETTAPIEMPNGSRIALINEEALRRAAGYAWPTLAFWVVVFVLADRYRPQRLLFWYLALGWGSCVATAASLEINTWASQQMDISGVNPAAGARSAIYVAPFVEEATKATVLFLIAMAVRYQMVSKLQAVSLAGLSAAGFAFTENILYYARAIVYGSLDIGVGNAEEAVRSLVMLRGVLLAFGHPLFTAMTAIGLVVALRTRSKVVRVLAPIVGYLAAAALHMTFNSVASLFDDGNQKLVFFTVAIPLLLSVIVYVGSQVFVEGHRHRDRLADFVRSGWLPESDVHVFSRQRSRWRLLLRALGRGLRPFVATIRLERTLTELVYLRDAQVHGIIDSAGDARARLLLDRARELRRTAVDDPSPRTRRQPEATKEQAPYRDSPGGVPVGVSSPPIGSPQQYSPVDQRWGPPTG